LAVVTLNVMTSKVHSFPFLPFAFTTLVCLLFLFLL
jgi:hypothetical protein